MCSSRHRYHGSICKYRVSIPNSSQPSLRVFSSILRLRYALSTKLVADSLHVANLVIPLFDVEVSHLLMRRWNECQVDDGLVDIVVEGALYGGDGRRTLCTHGGGACWL